MIFRLRTRVVVFCLLWDFFRLVLCVRVYVRKNSFSNILVRTIHLYVETRLCKGIMDSWMAGRYNNVLKVLKHM